MSLLFHLNCKDQGPQIRVLGLHNMGAHPKVLKILKFRGNKIDQDCKILKSNAENQENRVAEQFIREFIDKQVKSGKNLSIETRRGVPF